MAGGRDPSTYRTSATGDADVTGEGELETAREGGREMTAVLHALDFSEGIVEGDDLPPRVPDGEYPAIYVSHECAELRQFGGAPKVFVTVRLLDAGEHTGKLLFRAYRVLRVRGRRAFSLGRRSDLLKMYARVMETPDHRPRLDRINLRDLRPMLLRVRTRTVERDGKGRGLPESLRYSVVDEILGRGE
jgi:hypothetical protein